jgi:anti-sigma factor RsiW
MRCEEIRLLLNAHMDGELEAELSHIVARHVLRCTGCAHEVQSLQQTKSLLRECISQEHATDPFVLRTTMRLRESMVHHLRLPQPLQQSGYRQWTLPFNRDDQATGTD